MTPLFPLSAVLLPGASLSLRIFEIRYLDMVRRCLREDGGFGVVLLRSGNEVRRGDEQGLPHHCQVGTYARITDFDALPGGLLGIDITGCYRFRVGARALKADGLLLGEFHPLAEPDSVPAAMDEFPLLRECFAALARHPLVKKMRVDLHRADVNQLSYLLASFAPLSPSCRQRILEATDIEDRLEQLQSLLGA